MAQSVEHSLGKGEVTSSNLVIGTIFPRINRKVVLGLVMFGEFKSIKISGLTNFNL